MARPKGSDRPVDLKKLEKYAAIGATQIEIARVLGMSVATFERRLKKHENVREALDRGQAELYISLRTRQVQLALDGNPTMLIWLGKQLLGQKDKSDLAMEHSGPNGGALEVVFVRPKAE